jgi:hypothetical protein
MIAPWRRLLDWEFEPEFITFENVKPYFSRKGSSSTIERLKEYALREEALFAEEFYGIVLEANASNPKYPNITKPHGRAKLYTDFEKKSGMGLHLIRLAAKQLYVFLQSQPLQKRLTLVARHNITEGRKLKKAVKVIIEEVFDFEMLVQKEESEKTYDDVETFYRKFIADDKLRLQRLRKYRFIKEGKTLLLQRILKTLEN